MVMIKIRRLWTFQRFSAQVAAAALLLPEFRNGLIAAALMSIPATVLVILPFISQELLTVCFAPSPRLLGISS